MAFPLQTMLWVIFDIKSSVLFQHGLEFRLHQRWEAVPGLVRWRFGAVSFPNTVHSTLIGNKIAQGGDFRSLNQFQSGFEVDAVVRQFRSWPYTGLEHISNKRAANHRITSVSVVSIRVTAQPSWSLTFPN